MRFSETTKYLSNYLTFGRILSRLNNSRWDRYLGMTADITQLPVTTATTCEVLVFKGKKQISITRRSLDDKHFFQTFIRRYSK